VALVAIDIRRDEERVSSPDHRACAVIQLDQASCGLGRRRGRIADAVEIAQLDVLRTIAVRLLDDDIESVGQVCCSPIQHTTPVQSSCPESRAQTCDNPPGETARMNTGNNLQ
jgi:hypothetical protein